MATDARAWLLNYRQRNHRQMNAAQIRIVSTAARQCGSMTLDQFADAMRSTLATGEWSPKPIYMIGGKSAAYLLSIMRR